MESRSIAAYLLHNGCVSARSIGEVRSRIPSESEGSIVDASARKNVSLGGLGSKAEGVRVAILCRKAIQGVKGLAHVL